jgi:hypothetical protein
MTRRVRDIWNCTEKQLRGDRDIKEGRDRM